MVELIERRLKGLDALGDGLQRSVYLGFACQLIVLPRPDPDSLCSFLNAMAGGSGWCLDEKSQQ